MATITWLLSEHLFSLPRIIWPFRIMTYGSLPSSILVLSKMFFFYKYWSSVHISMECPSCILLETVPCYISDAATYYSHRTAGVLDVKSQYDVAMQRFAMVLQISLVLTAWLGSNERWMKGIEMLAFLYVLSFWLVYPAVFIVLTQGKRIY